MRIIRGSLKGMRFKKMKSFSSRPTTDFAKEGLFNILENSMNIEGLVVLDLFAGLGNISFEFISRGAKELLSIDLSHQSCRYMKANSKAHNLEGIHRIIQMDALKFIGKNIGTFDCIFADPPYDFENYEKLLILIEEKMLLKKGGILIIEHGRQTTFEHKKGFQKVKQFGHVYFSFFNFETNEA